MNKEKMREEFEQQYCTMLSFKHSNELFRRCENGRYVRIDVELQWQWWQAACASKQKEIDNWKIVAEDWRVKAVEWSRKNAMETL